MTPIEAMAKAAYDEWIEPVVGIEPAWGKLPESHRSRMVESQRAALLALAEVDLTTYAPEDWQYMPYPAIIKSILRSLAEGGEA